jgi:type IV pilus assembly protein PilV
MKSLLHKQSGVSLIEVLVTLVLISIALLGSASLQVLSKRSNYEAVQRTSAAHLANDLLARMRANRGALDGYLPAALLGGTTLKLESILDCADDSVTCNSTDVAAYELWQWEQQLDGAAESDTATGAASGGLLEPTACITGPAGGVGGVYEVAIAWRGGVEHLNPEIHDCGIDTNKYGEDNEFRHVLVMRTFLDTE